MNEYTSIACCARTQFLFFLLCISLVLYQEMYKILIINTIKQLKYLKLFGCLKKYA